MTSTVAEDISVLKAYALGDPKGKLASIRSNTGRTLPWASESSMSSSVLDGLLETLEGFRIKLHARLKDNEGLGGPYGNYIDFMGELMVITERIGLDIQSLASARNRLVEYTKLHPNQVLPIELTEPFYEWSTKVRLDLKDIFVHTRIFLDTICLVIKVAYGNKGKGLNNRMTQLLQSDYSLQLDHKFFTGLRDKLAWYDDFVKRRDRVVHSFGMFRFIHEDDGARFEVIGKIDDTWGPNTKKVTQFVEDVISNLTILVNYVNTNLTWGLGEQGGNVAERL